MSTVYFCISYETKNNIVEKPQFLAQMTKFWVSMTPCRPNVLAENWPQIIRNVHFMHLGQLLGFICELGNKRRAALTKNPDFWSN